MTTVNEELASDLQDMSKHWAYREYAFLSADDLKTALAPDYKAK